MKLKIWQELVESGRVSYNIVANRCELVRIYAKYMNVMAVMSEINRPLVGIATIMVKVGKILKGLQI